MKFLLNTLCLTIALLLGGTSSIAKAADYPKYGGTISPIDQPILLRNRPHPSSKWSKQTALSFSFGKEKVNLMQLFTGKTKVIQSASSIVQILEIEEMIMETKDQKKKEKAPRFLLKLIMTPRGEYQSIELEGPDISNEDKRKIDQYSPLVITFLNSTIKSLPQNGLLKNHEFFNITETALNFSEYVPSVYVPEGLKLNISYRGIASGVAQYKGRQVIVINISGKISIGDTQIENISLKNLRVRANGYALMDTFSGRWIFSDILMEGDGTVGEQDVFGEIRETLEVHLHASTPKHKYSSKMVSTKMSLQEAKAECAELGFKKGTEKFGTCVMRLID